MVETENIRQAEHDPLYSEPSALEINAKDAYRNFLQECMKENLNHCRHIENERHNFLSLHLVVVGLFTTAIFNTETSPWIAMMLSIVLLTFSSIMSELFRRWDRVYNGHMDTAKRLARMIDNDCVQLDEAKFCPIDDHLTPGRHPNFFYYFDNTVGKNSLKLRAERAEEDAKTQDTQPAFKNYIEARFRDSWKIGRGVYIRTHSLYLRFCHLVTLIECMGLLLAIIRIIKQTGLIELIMEII